MQTPSSVRIKNRLSRTNHGDSSPGQLARLREYRDLMVIGAGPAGQVVAGRAVRGSFGTDRTCGRGEPDAGAGVGWPNRHARGPGPPRRIPEVPGLREAGTPSRRSTPLARSGSGLCLRTVCDSRTRLLDPAEALKREPDLGRQVEVQPGRTVERVAAEELSDSLQAVLEGVAMYG